MPDHDCDVLLITRDQELRDQIARLCPPSAVLRCETALPAGPGGLSRGAQLWIDLDAVRDPPPGAGRRVYFYSRAPDNPDRYPPGTFLRKPCPAAAIAILWAGVATRPASVPPAPAEPARPQQVPTWLLDLNELDLSRLISLLVFDVPDRLGYRHAALYLNDPDAGVLRLDQARELSGLPAVVRPEPSASHPLGRAAATAEITTVTLSRAVPTGANRRRGVIRRWASGQDGGEQTLELLVLPLPGPAARGPALEGLLCLSGRVQTPTTEVGLPLEELARAAGRALSHARRYARAVAEARLDALTGLYNCRWLNEQLEREIWRVRRSGGSLSIVMLDLDDLKRVNDRYGHIAGDAVLRNVADCIRGVLRHADAAARLGGDEFVVVLPDTDAAGAEHVAGRIAAALRRNPTRIDEGTIAMTASLGVATWEPEQTVQELIDRADRAMYARKRAARTPSLQS